MTRAHPAPSSDTQSAIYPASASITIVGNANGAVITAGKGHTVIARVNVQLNETAPQPTAPADILATLSQIRAIFASSDPCQNEHKINRALDDADEEAQKENPDKTDIGGALKRALDYAEQAGKLTEIASKLAPHVLHAVRWLGTQSQYLLAKVGPST